MILWFYYNIIFCFITAFLCRNLSKTTPIIPLCSSKVKTLIIVFLLPRLTFKLIPWKHMFPKGCLTSECIRLFKITSGLPQNSKLNYKITLKILMSLSKSPFSLLKMHLYYFPRNMIKCNGIVGERKAQKILMQITGKSLKIYKEEE